jgi:hypothetical protein
MNDEHFDRKVKLLRQTISELPAGEERNALDRLLLETLTRHRQIQEAAARTHQSKIKLNSDLEELAQSMNTIRDRLQDLRLLCTYLRFDYEARRREAKGS